MAELADVYDSLRQEICGFVAELPPEDLDRIAPATPEWTIKEIMCHLAANATSLINADWPTAFFAAFAQPDAIAVLNTWTDAQVTERKDRSLVDLASEWEISNKALVPMLRGDEPLPAGVPFFTDRLMIIDATAHQQDIYGALGINKDRDSSVVRVGVAGYIATMGSRLDSDGIAPLAFELGDKTRVAGDGDPAATVSASRFELFRALSGRRSPDQVRSYEWNGDPEPYLSYFYPYGPREDALVE